jgi:hypothetical protein
MSTAYLISNIASFLVLPYTQPQLTSTIQNLGSLGYISGASLAPTFQGLGATYITTPYLVTNIPNLPYMKQPDLTTATSGELTLYSNLLSSNLISTVQNLGSLGYISTSINPTSVLTSTSVGIANILAGATYPPQTIQNNSITGSASNLFKYVNGSIVASASITASATEITTQNLYTFCNLTASTFYGSNYYADGTQLANSSDRRLKKDIVAMSNALEKINALTGIYFTRKDDPTHKRHVGFIAQELERVFPDIVVTDGEGMKSVKYDSIHVAILEAIKELDAELDSLIH